MKQRFFVTSSSGTRPGFLLQEEVRAPQQNPDGNLTFEFLPDIGHLLVYPLFFQVPNPGAANVRNEL